MRHPSLLGNKQAQALSELGGEHNLVWEMVPGSLPGAPLFSPRPWTPAHDFWDPWVTTGMTAAAPGVWMLVVWLWQGVWLSHMSLGPVGSPCSAMPAAGPERCPG